MPGVYDREKNSAITRSISPSYSNALSTYFGEQTPDFGMAEGSHNAYVAALEAHGTNVTILPPLSKYPDSCFVEDTAVIFEDLAVICSPGHPSRANEVHTISERLSKDFEIKFLSPEAKMDGGDIVYESFKDGIVYLQMQGSCSGCPSSTATLKMGIENMLKHYVPEVKEVRPTNE